MSGSELSNKWAKHVSAHEIAINVKDFLTHHEKKPLRETKTQNFKRLDLKQELNGINKVHLITLTLMRSLSLSDKTCPGGSRTIKSTSKYW